MVYCQTMDKYEIRRLNLIALMNSRCKGKASALADQMGRSASYVSRMLAPEGKAAKKNIGEDMVELIEKTFNLEKGALDQPGAIPELPADPPISLPFHGARRVAAGQPSNVVPIKKVSLTLQAGIMGFEATQETGEDSTILIPVDFIEQNNLVPQCLIAITIKGESMWPLMIEGDVVVINIADTKPINGELYALNFDGEAVVKQLIYEGRQWYLNSMNPNFKRTMVREGECVVIGRVVYQPGRKLIGRV